VTADVASLVTIKPKAGFFTGIVKWISEVTTSGEKGIGIHNNSALYYLEYYR
jgi:hypothetical protein